MITWKDGSEPAMRRPVRGHDVEFYQVTMMDLGGWKLHARCLVCKTLWDEPVSYTTKCRILVGPNRRGTVASVVALAVSRTPICEEAYRHMVAREVLET